MSTIEERVEQLEQKIGLLTKDIALLKIPETLQAREERERKDWEAAQIIRHESATKRKRATFLENINRKIEDLKPWQEFLVGAIARVEKELKALPDKTVDPNEEYQIRIQQENLECTMVAAKHGTFCHESVIRGSGSLPEWSREAGFAKLGSGLIQVNARLQELNKQTFEDLNSPGA